METSATALSEARGHLDRIRRSLAEGHRDLYRDLALYLQVLREGLLDTVQQAVFHVATQVVPERYQQLSDLQRQELPWRLEQLVHRCCCLLTLEQLLVLARQVQTEKRRQGELEQRRLNQALEQMSSEAGSDPETDDQEEREEPAGSIRLDLNLPLSAELFSAGIPALAGLSELLEAPSNDIAGHEDQDVDLEEGEEVEEDEEDREADPVEGEADDPTDILRALLVMANSGETQDQGPGLSVPHSAETAESPSSEPGGSRNEPGLVPRQPLELLEWWKALDRALQRRLRNLSHAINLDLIKLGLTRSLLPLSLLDAVLQGQLEALPAPANLLKIQLPFGTPDTPAQVQALGVLLLTGDIEYEQPRLRTCRKRLEQRRASVRKMAQQYRHWQRRARAQEAEQQWMQDSQSSPEAPA